MTKITTAKTQDDKSQKAEISESDPSLRNEDYSSGSDGSGHQSLERGSKKSRVKKVE